ncbi:MAG: hypothetical protein ACTSRF_11150 [Candidatus Freyarchaeota archaeon]
MESEKAKKLEFLVEFFFSLGNPCVFLLFRGKEVLNGSAGVQEKSWNKPYKKAPLPISIDLNRNRFPGWSNRQPIWGQTPKPETSGSLEILKA